MRRRLRPNLRLGELLDERANERVSVALGDDAAIVEAGRAKHANHANQVKQADQDRQQRRVGHGEDLEPDQCAQSGDHGGQHVAEHVPPDSGKGLVDFLDRFRYEEVFDEARRYKYFRDHPLSSDRIDSLMSRVEAMPHYRETDGPEAMAEVRKIIDAQRARALDILRRRQHALDALVEKLLVEETLEKEQLDEILVKSMEKAAE